MNVILILIDSLNRHKLSFYNATRVHTPNLDAFAKRAWRMDNHFVGSLPCMPARREIFTGQKEMMWRPWGPLEYGDPRLPRLLSAQGVSTAIVTDHYHYWEEEANGYVQSFQSAEFIRGHEVDFWKQPLKEGEESPEWIRTIARWRPEFARRYYANIRDFGGEEDYFPAKVMTGASSWLRQNALSKKPFFLQIESFDVHEPFHNPEPYRSMYVTKGASEAFNVWPPYQNPQDMRAFMDAASPEEMAYLEAQYDGKMTMVDRWLGDVFRQLDEQNLWDDTAVVITTDHGHDLGQHRKFGKQWPHYDSHANIPMLVWHPKYPGNGRSLPYLTQTVDLFASVLDLAGVPAPANTHSRSFVPLLRGDDASKRDVLLYGTFGQGVCVTDGTWSLFKSPEKDQPLYYYSSMIYQSLISSERVEQPVAQGYFNPRMNYPQWRIPIHFDVLSYENFLFNRPDDPNQDRNLWDTEREKRQQMRARLIEALYAEGAPAEQFDRLGLIRS